jgi:hypothetical protein
MEETLIQAIREAFAVTEPPTGPVVTHSCSECDGVAAALQGRRWQELDELLLVRQPDMLPLLSPEALSYHLPAFLIAALRHRDRCVGDVILMELEPDRRRLRDRFTAAQRVVIVSWARVYYGPDYVGGGPEAYRRLEQSWLGGGTQ